MWGHCLRAVELWLSSILISVIIQSKSERYWIDDTNYKGPNRLVASWNTSVLPDLRSDG
jgi:hypothetical protein